MSCLADIDVAILCGGKGTRARTYLGDTPKVLAPLGGRPFIEHHIDYLRQYGAKRINLLAGHGHEKVQHWFSDYTSRKPSIDLAIVVDRKCAGGGNALYDAREIFRTPLVLITNGDTLLIGNLEPIIFNMRNKPALVLTVGGHSSGMCLTMLGLIQAKYFLAIPIEALFDFSFIDIGTLEGYRRAQEYFGDHHTDAVPS